MRKMHIMESSIIERDSEELVFDMYISLKWEFPFVKITLHNPSKTTHGCTRNTDITSLTHTVNMTLVWGKRYKSFSVASVYLQCGP